MRSLLCFILLLVVTAPVVVAHEMRPAYLEITEIAPEHYAVLWKVPARGGNERLSLHVRFDDATETIEEPVSGIDGGAHIERWQVTRPGGLTGSTVSIDGLTATLTDVLARVSLLGIDPQSALIKPEKPFLVVAEVPTRGEVAWNYLTLGVQHILGGIDHLLFVLCLMIVAGINRKLLITVTGFTLAHSITLALAALGVVNIPVPPVEAVIALSIVFLAVEIAKGDKTSLTYRYPVAVSVSFGLLHGFGFAAVLSEIGLPRTEIPIALLFFNVGVEVGQLMFIATLIVMAFVEKHIAGLLKQKAPAILTPRLASYVIGAVASFWLIQRVAGFSQG